MPHRFHANCSGLQSECAAAARDGDYKFLKIMDNTFLFNVVEDHWSAPT